MEHQEGAIIAELRGFRELFEERTTNMMSELGDVKAQTLKTNGRVNAAETSINDIRLIIAEWKGKGSILTAIWIIVGSIVSGLGVHWLWGK